MKVQFVPGENEAYYKSEVFGKILDFVQKHPKTSKLKESNKKLSLIFESVSTVEKAYTKLKEIHSVVFPK